MEEYRLVPLNAYEWNAVLYEKIGRCCFCGCEIYIGKYTNDFCCRCRGFNLIIKRIWNIALEVCRARTKNRKKYIESGWVTPKRYCPTINARDIEFAFEIFWWDSNQTPKMKYTITHLSRTKLRKMGRREGVRRCSVEALIKLKEILEREYVK